MTEHKHQFKPEQFFSAEALKPFMNMGGVNYEELMNQQRNSLQSVAQLGRDAAEAARELAECQTRYAREAMEDTASFWRNWMSSGANLRDKMELQNQATREGMAKVMAHNKEVNAIMQKSQEKAMHAWTDQLQQSTRK